METLVLKNTVRGGKQYEHGGDVIVMGDVYPGTTITAGGNIVVMGCAQGSLIAGTKIGEAATIAVGKFKSPYVKVGRFSARQEAEEATGPEFLCVEKGQLVSKQIKTNVY